MVSLRIFLFTNFRIEKKGKRIACLNKVITYDNCLKCLREVMDRVGLVGRDFTLLSVKTGSFSEACNSGKVELSLLRRHARWVSRSMEDRYHKRSLAASLEPTRALKINQ